MMDPPKRKRGTFSRGGPVVGAMATLGAAVMVAGCGGSTAAGTSNASSGSKQFTIGISSAGWEIPPLKDAGQAAQTEAKAEGVSVVFGLSDTAAGQATDVQDLIARHVNVLAIDPNDASALAPVIRQANQAGIPVITWVAGIPSGKTIQNISTPEVTGGELVTRWVVNQLHGAGQVALLQGSVAQPAGRARETGFRSVLKSNPGVKLVSYGQGQWLRDQGDEVATNFLTRTPNLNAIVALNDEMALGALKAAQARSVAGKVIITGYNGECVALQSIWSNGLSATLYQPFRDMGIQIVKTAVAIKNHQSVPATISMPEMVIDRSTMKAIDDGSMKVTPGVKASVVNAINGCK